MRYRAELDGLRALCILFTVCLHVDGTPAFINGTIGVDLFFALSGWLITTLIFAEREKTGQFGVSAFYVRRIFRILPVYFLTLLLYMGAAWAAERIGDPSKAAEMHRSFWYMVTLSSEYRPVTDTVFAHGWTLGIEEKFYLIWPAMLALTAFRGWRSLLICAAIYAALTWLMYDLEGMYRAAGGIRGYLGLTFGSALAMLAREERWRAWLAKAGTGATLAIAALYTGSLIAPHWAWNVSIAGTGAVMVGSMWNNHDQIIARALSFAPLAAVGRLTYAIYMLHVLCKHAGLVLLTKLHLPTSFPFAFAALYAISIVVALVVWLVVERPMIAIGRRLADKTRPAPLASFESAGATN